ncbi:MAG TPA: four helix bundle protein [Candidatus Marinimicrobia bacterium]|nr:four helix bundle protein [Candidatus Neomarinimicrobiota bacterium]HRS51834.1 four helix bundle protein [Candidatus Neomarinimicrobiota bacterium]HRU92705.1 four helix bundle protein [Candidatus Neomarinimicrobiota bacterium]
MSEVTSLRKNINRGFRKLDIWQLSIGYYKLIVEILSKCELIPFKVKAQIEDSALSISSNIAEGYARRTLKENLRFNEIALSSSAENCSQLHALKESGQISGTEFELLDAKLYEVENKIIRMNKALIKKMKDGGNWTSDY